MHRQFLKHFENESDAWKRKLIFLTSENNFLKQRLTETLKDGISSEMLPILESFQTGFVTEDELIAVLRNDIAEFEKILQEENFDDEPITGMLKKMMNALRSNIARAENRFETIKTEFNLYLSEYIPSQEKL